MSTANTVRACLACGLELEAAGRESILGFEFNHYLADCPRCGHPVVPLVAEGQRKSIEERWEQMQKPREQRVPGGVEDLYPIKKEE